MPRWFDLSEFDSPDAPGSGNRISPDLLDKLNALRERLGFPLVVASGVRTEEHNAEVGGVDGSAHVSGLAADLVAIDSASKFRIVAGALMLGFRRIGVGARFVHLDMDESKPQGVLWTY